MSIDVSDIRFGVNISEGLYSDIAEEKAKRIAEVSGDKVNKSTQIRRFYDELCLWNGRINSTGTPEERQARYRELAPLVKMLKAKVAYARGRKPKLVEENFESMFCRCINEVKDPKTLEQCKLFMEAFMGFYKGYNG